MSTLSYNSKTFLLNGEEFRILSGAIHYFRVVPEYWEDRLKKLKACGFNTVETYCSWNLHEIKEGEYDFTGILDLKKFLETAQKVGLKAIVRPGPFICAEFDYGGLPYWLNNYNMRIRCFDEVYLEKVRRYFKVLCEQIKPQLDVNGGNVIAMQIENEYGSYCNDKEYLREIAKMYIENGMDCLYFTSDGPGDLYLSSGTIPEYLATCNFGSRGKEAFECFRKHRPNEPFVCMEFWNGWFDHWGEEHHTRTAEDAVKAMEEILDQNDGNGNVNFYMFHGGTNFGFTSGANFDANKGGHQPTITSYDYDSPLSECGDMTDKYYAVKESLEKRYGKAPELDVKNLPKKAYGKVELTKKGGLFYNLNNLSKSVDGVHTLTMEELGLPFGFVMYSTVLRGATGGEVKLSVDDVRDRAMVYLDGKLAGIKDCMGRDDIINVCFGEKDSIKLDILVENMGRINFGHEIGEKKGIENGVRVGFVHQTGYTMYPMQLNDISAVEYENAVEGQPTFYSGEFEVDELCDTFVLPEGFTKGVIYINGFNLGRYWNEKGPQKTLYIPAPLLKMGKNELVVLELEGTDREYLSLLDAPDLGWFDVLKI